MFLDPVPQDVILRRYDEAGNLVEVVLPNRAKDRITAYSGAGNPNGVQVANMGALYIDTTNSDLYYKSQGSNDTGGWVLLWSSENLRENEAGGYLTPDGDGSLLTNLNVNNVGIGTLTVNHGGTGATNFGTGLVKANGTNPFTTAIEGVDYLGQTNFVGTVTYYAGSPAKVPRGWLHCNGALYAINDYPLLFDKIGTLYGGDGVTTFAVPSLMNKDGYATYIRNWDGGSAVGQYNGPHLQNHQHALQYDPNNVGQSAWTADAGGHTHGGGSLTVGGSFETIMAKTTQPSGCFYTVARGTAYIVGNQSFYDHTFLATNMSNKWGGATASAGAHNHAVQGRTMFNPDDGNVDNHPASYQLIPIIKY